MSDDTTPDLVERLAALTLGLLPAGLTAVGAPAGVVSAVAGLLGAVTPWVQRQLRDQLAAEPLPALREPTPPDDAATVANTLRRLGVL